MPSRCGVYSTAVRGRFLRHVGSLKLESVVRQNRKDNALSWPNAAIETLNLAKEIPSITPAKVVFGSVNLILTIIRVDLSRLC